MQALFSSDGQGLPSVLLFLMVFAGYIFAVPFAIYQIILQRQLRKKKDSSQAMEAETRSPSPSATSSPEAGAEIIAPGNRATPKTYPITRKQFADHAKALRLVIDGQQLPEHAQPKEFNTKSIGWNCKGKITLEVDGIQVPCWVLLNVTVIGSKKLPREAHTAAATQPVENEKKNGDVTRDERDRLRIWNKCLKTMGQQDRDCGAAVSMYYERIHAFPKGLRYSPERSQLQIPVRVFVPHWQIL